MIDYDNRLRKIYQRIKQKVPAGTVVDLSYKYFDEPRLFNFVYLINTAKHNQPNQIGAIGDQLQGMSGSSLFSPQLALLKLLAEIIEKSSLLYIKKDEIAYCQPKKAKIKAGEQKSYFATKAVNTLKRLETSIFGWVKCDNLITNRKEFIPCQWLYPNYLTYLKIANKDCEPLLTEPLSLYSGAAAGLDQSSTLLRAIYEAVERDALTTLYLNKLHPPEINLQTLNKKSLIRLIETVVRHRLALRVFDISNDTGIPVYMSLIIDKTGIGPFLNLGFRADYNNCQAITESIEDALTSRLQTRILWESKMTNYLSLVRIKVNNRTMRCYLRKNTFEKFHYLISQINTTSLQIAFKTNKDSSLSHNKKLLKIIGSFKKIGFTIWSKNILAPFYNNLGLSAFKVIIPDLQLPLSHPTKRKFILGHRIDSVKKFYRKKYGIV